MKKFWQKLGKEENVNRGTLIINVIQTLALIVGIIIGLIQVNSLRVELSDISAKKISTDELFTTQTFTLGTGEPAFSIMGNCVEALVKNSKEWVRITPKPAGTPLVWESGKC